MDILHVVGEGYVYRYITFKGCCCVFVLVDCRGKGLFDKGKTKLYNVFTIDEEEEMLFLL